MTDSAYPKTFVLYHDDNDGHASALSFLLIYGQRATYCAVQYGQDLPDLPYDKDSHVYIVDFSYKRHILQSLNQRVGKLLVIDHHKTAAEDLKGLPYCVFDETTSGAELTWKTMMPNTEVPELVKLVGDRDIWRFAYEDTRALHAGILSSGRARELPYWLELYSDQELYKQTIQRGHILDEERRKITEAFAYRGNWRRVIFNGMEFALYNQTSLISEQAEAIYELDGLPEATLSYFISSKGEMVFSLRSWKHSGIDVSALARAYGGGGHTHAAGFSMGLAEGAKLLEGMYSQPGG